jgi:hypothetical protein
MIPSLGDCRSRLDAVQGESHKYIGSGTVANPLVLARERLIAGSNVQVPGIVAAYW